MENKTNNDLVFLNNFLEKKFGKRNWAKAKERARQKKEMEKRKRKDHV